MPTYSKAYLLADLRKFPGWTSCAVEKAGLNTYGGNGGTLSAEDTDANNDVAYVMESLKVTVNPVNLDSQGDWILTKVSPEWEAFCKNELKFEAGLLNISGVQGVQLSPWASSCAPLYSLRGARWPPHSVSHRISNS